MKSTGIVRKLDNLGRVVLPIELRRGLQLQEKDPVEIFIDGEMIILQKYQAQKACVITGEILPENKEYAPGLFLSPEGAKKLLLMIQQGGK